MPRLLEPGDAGVFDLELTAPEEAGRYIIELDMVEEGVTWFADQGSQTLRVPVQVSSLGLKRGIGRRLRSSPLRPASPSGPPANVGEPVMEMHCLSREEVLAVVKNAGGEAVHTDEYDAIGDGQVTCSYVVRQAGRADR